MTPAKLIAKLKAQGFTEWNSGGGYSALRKDLENGAYVLVTDMGCSIPSGDSPYIVAYYVDDQQKLSEILEDAKAALDKADVYCAIRQRQGTGIDGGQTLGSTVKT